MRQFNKLRGIKGFVTMWERCVRFRYMITDEAKRRVRILAFWERHGLQATREAFGVSRATLFRWQAALTREHGKLEGLNARSTAPKRRRKRIIPDAVRGLIIRERYFDPRMGKEKLSVLLKEDGIAQLSPSTVGRMLIDLKRQGTLPDPRPLSFHARTGRHHEKHRMRRKKLRRIHKRGMELDTIVRFIDGTKRYILTAIDVERRFAFAGAYTSHSSSSAADFLGKLIRVCPFPVDELQTDNGSEFAKHFEMACALFKITHFHTYPRSPQMNPFIERFNRTLSEGFIQYHRGLLRDDLPAFNGQLVDWLFWYNTRRPHLALGLRSPLQYIVSTLSEEESHMLWTSTSY